MKMTIKDYCKELLWSVSDLSRQAGISWQAAQRAFKGEAVQARTRRDICKALSSALHENIAETDVDWQTVQED